MTERHPPYPGENLQKRIAPESNHLDAAFFSLRHSQQESDSSAIQPKQEVFEEPVFSSDEEEAPLRLVVENKERQTLAERRIMLPPMEDDSEEWWQKEGERETRQNAQRKTMTILEQYAPQGAMIPEEQWGHLRSDYEKQIEDFLQEGFVIFEENVRALQTILPSFHLDVLYDVLQQQEHQTAFMMSVAKTKDSQNRKEQEELLHAFTYGLESLQMIERYTQALLQKEAERYFAPLIERARGDMRMDIIKFARSRGLRLEHPETQTEEHLKQLMNFVDERSAIVLPIEFHYDFFKKLEEKNDSEVAYTDSKTKIYLNLNALIFSFLEDGTFDDIEMLTTLIHEMIHTITDQSEGIYGLQDPSFFPSVLSEQNKTPEVFLNELRTETRALALSAKYYEHDAPGTIRLSRKEKQTFSGYENLVQRYAKLCCLYPQEMDELSKKLADGMYLGKREPVREFFFHHPAIYEELVRMTTEKIIT